MIQTVTLEKCSSCKQKHEDMPVYELVNPIYDEGTVWTHYALCPVTAARILLRIIILSKSLDNRHTSTDIGGNS